MNPDDVPAEEGQSFPTNTGRNLIDLDEKAVAKEKAGAPAILEYDGALQDSANTDAGIQAAHDDSRPIAGR